MSDREGQDMADEVMAAAEVDGLYDDEEHEDAPSSSFAGGVDDPLDRPHLERRCARVTAFGSSSAIPPMTRADEIVDQLLPEGFEWRRLVCSYPKTAMAVSVVGGFVLGRAHGAGMLAGLTGFVLGEVSRNVQEFVEDFGA